VGGLVSQPDLVGRAPTHVQLLGGFAVTPGAQSASLSGNAERVVAFVALHGCASRLYVAGSLWPDVPEARSLGSLRTTIWRIHRAFPGLFTGDGHVVRLSPSVRVDLERLEGQIHQLLHDPDDSVIPDLPRLIGTGTLLPGWYDDWVIASRERLRQLYLEALDVLAERQLADGRPAQALEAALTAAAVEPLRETAHRSMMRAHLATGNVVEALRILEDFTGRLGREMGVSPSPEMRALLADALAVRRAAHVTRV
jgi:DNA-binding SARP family transcriptional activator